jgi:hypothetical protein
MVTIYKYLKSSRAEVLTRTHYHGHQSWLSFDSPATFCWTGHACPKCYSSVLPTNQLASSLGLVRNIIFNEDLVFIRLPWLLCSKAIHWQCTRASIWLACSSYLASNAWTMLSLPFDGHDEARLHRSSNVHGIRWSICGAVRSELRTRPVWVLW